MPYFLVAVGFALANIVLATVTLACLVAPRLRRGLPFAWRVWLWSSVGCVVANLPIVALYLVPAALERAGVTPAPGVGKSALGVMLAVGLMIGPIVASAFGFIGGAAAGLILAIRATTVRAGD